MSLSKIFYSCATCIVFLILCLYFFHPITGLVGDLAYYLTIGKIIYQTGTVPATNLFSYTYPNFPFINLNWLSELIFYLIQKSSGFNGLIVTSVTLIVSTFSILFIAAAKKTNIFTTIMISLLYLQILYERTEVKPELFSYLFLVLFIVILYTYKERYTKWIFALIPLELLWVNFHIYFFLGIVVLLLFLLDAFIERKNKLRSKKIVTLFAVTLATVMITISNPNLVRGAMYPLFVLHNYGFQVAENIGFLTAIDASYNDPTFLFFGISVAILWTCMLISIKRMTVIDYFLAIFFTFMGFFAIRAFPLFVIGTFIPCVKSASYIWHSLVETYMNNKVLLLEGITVACILVLLLPTITSDIALHGLGFGVVDNAHNAISFLTKNNLKGPLYNNYDIGAYLEYRLYPKERVFVDNRPEAYPKDFFQNVYFPMQESIAFFNQKSNNYHFTTAVIEHMDTSIGTTKLLQQLITSNEWKLVYVDNTMVIFLRNSPRNTSFIAAHLITQDTITINNDELNSKEKVGHLVNLFRAIGWDKPWLAMNMRYLHFDPTNCSALQNIAYILQKQNSPEAQRYVTKYLQTCIQ